jgi:hypothetical protein
MAGSLNEKTGSEETNIQYAEGAAVMPRREGGGLSTAAALNRKRTRQGRTEHAYSEAIVARGTRVRHLRLPSMCHLRVRALGGKVGGDKEGLISLSLWRGGTREPTDLLSKRLRL